MTGSIAEERIRAKVEAALRCRRPEARIIHELVLTQGGVRIDLAAVWSDGMILAEIKSERDTLSRVQEQLRIAGRFGCETWICLAEKWRDPIAALAARDNGYIRVPIRKGDDGLVHGYLHKPRPNPCCVPELNSADVLIRFETDAGLEPISMHASWLERPRVLNPKALLNMLWAEELRDLTGQAQRASRGTCIVWATENLTGREIRRRVCAALMVRQFPRADAVVEAMRREARAA